MGRHNRVSSTRLKASLFSAFARSDIDNSEIEHPEILSRANQSPISYFTIRMVFRKPWKP